MLIITAIDALRIQIKAWHDAGETVAFVPTMGNLHAGHIDLVRHGQRHATKTVVSIFVNPTQFGPQEDFNSYPRTMEADIEKLNEVGADLLFCPTVNTLYPHGESHITRVEVPTLSDILCGAHRPGHFQGVAQIVAKLFNMVQPDMAIFGQKDRQQLMVIERMTLDLNLPIQIIGVPTIRDADGLAMSSRNRYLAADERRHASVLYQQLKNVAQQLQQGQRDFMAIETQAISTLESIGFKADYFRIVNHVDYSDPMVTAQATDLCVVAAAWLGKARLIDNVLVSDVVI